MFDNLFVFILFVCIVFVGSLLGVVCEMDLLLFVVSKCLI